MQDIRIQAIKDKIYSKIQTGDYIILANILNINRNTAVSRFNRNNKNTILIMKKIVDNREKLIKKLRASQGIFN